MASAQIANTFGIVVSLVGVLILFRYGMPFHVPTGGKTGLDLGIIDESEKALEARYTVFGYLGLFLIALGAIAQVVAVWI